MVRRNVHRQDCENSYYHVYNRGVAKMDIFRDDEDFRYFEMLLARHLSSKQQADKVGRVYKNYHDRVMLHAYCLMPNHFHLLLWQREAGDIKHLMSTVGVSYAMYFNKKYKRQGPLFESRYKAVLAEDTPQLKHLSRYIHLNPMGYRLWDYSSYSDYVYEPREWVVTSYILSLFKFKQSYLDFTDDYEDVKKANDRYKALLDQ